MGVLFGDLELPAVDVELLFGLLLVGGCFFLVTLPMTVLLSLLMLQRRRQRIMTANPDRRDL
jgi:hypothetical protein